MSWRQVRALARKEWIHVIRDPGTLAILVLIPVFLLVLFGYAIDLDVRNVRLAVWDNDGSRDSRQLVRLLHNSGYFQIVAYPESQAAADQLLYRERVDATVSIPRGLARGLLREEPASIALIVDGANSLQGATATALFDATLAASASRDPPVELSVRTLYNPRLESTRFLVPGLIAMILVITAVVSTALALVRERERGTIEQLIVAGIRPGELIAGKVTPYVAVSVLVSLLVLIAGYLLFGVTVAGSIAALTLVTAIFLLACLGLGLLVSTVARTQQVAFLIAVLATYLPSFLLSGFVFPLRNAPLPIQRVSYLVPARYYLHALRSVMLKGAGFEAVAVDALALAGFALLTLSVAAVRLARIGGRR